MASNGKKKTTMAKLNREHKLRERRATKKAKKDARKLAPSDIVDDHTAEAEHPDTATPELAAVGGTGLGA